MTVEQLLASANELMDQADAPAPESLQERLRLIRKRAQEIGLRDQEARRFPVSLRGVAQELMITRRALKHLRYITPANYQSLLLLLLHYATRENVEISLTDPDPKLGQFLLLQTQAGQISFRLKKQLADLLTTIGLAQGGIWDGHSTEDKRERITRLLNGSAQLH